MNWGTNDLGITNLTHTQIDWCAVHSQLTLDIIHTGSYYTVSQQKVQLSQRDRETLRVMEYFAKLPNVTQGHSK